MMQLAISIFPDLDGLDDLISQSETVLAIYLAVLAIVVVFVVVGACVERFKARSPVEKLIRRRFG